MNLIEIHHEFHPHPAPVSLKYISSVKFPQISIIFINNYNIHTVLLFTNKSFILGNPGIFRTNRQFLSPANKMSYITSFFSKFLGVINVILLGYGTYIN